MTCTRGSLLGSVRHTPDSLTEDFLFEEINTDTSKQLGTWLPPGALGARSFAFVLLSLQFSSNPSVRHVGHPCRMRSIIVQGRSVAAIQFRNKDWREGVRAAFRKFVSMARPLNIRPGPSEDFFLALFEACKPGKRLANAAGNSHHELACEFMRERPRREPLTHLPPDYPHTRPPTYGPTNYYPRPLIIPSLVD